MENYILRERERVILEDHQVAMKRDSGNLSSTTYSLVLTTERILLWKKGLLGKKKEQFDIALEDLYERKGEPYVSMTKYSIIGQWLLEFSAAQGLFSLMVGSSTVFNKETTKKWVDEICLAYRLRLQPDSQIPDPKRIRIWPFQSKEAERDQEPEITKKCAGCLAPLTGRKGETVQCTWCDLSQTL